MLWISEELADNFIKIFAIFVNTPLYPGLRCGFILSIYYVAFRGFSKNL